MTNVRPPAVAGRFYPADAGRLRREVEGLLAVTAAPTHARLAYVPHAGYTYSGRIAGAAYGELCVPPLVVLVAPRHHPTGAALALPARGSWSTPLGELALAEDVVTAIAASSSVFRDDWAAHAADHAIEVQLPFLQVQAERAGTLPALVTLAVGTADLEALLEAGRALAAALTDCGRSAVEDVLLVVSGDMSHFIPAALAWELDTRVLDLALELRAEELHREVVAKDLTICGAMPAVVGLAAAREMGAAPGRVVARGHSGEVTGDDADVVAYASLVYPAAAA